MEQAVADLDKIRTSAAKLRALIDDMVDLAKLQAGQIALRSTTFYVADLVEDVLVQAAAKADVNGNTLTVEVNVSPEDLRADANRVRQVLTALLDNACKFTENGEVVVQVVDLEDRGRVSSRGLGNRPVRREARGSIPTVCPG